jgi:hypothetical protein
LWFLITSNTKLGNNIAFLCCIAKYAILLGFRAVTVLTQYDIILRSTASQHGESGFVALILLLAMP